MTSYAGATIAVNNLSPDHLDAFVRAVTHVVSADLTTPVLAQIVDGKSVPYELGFNERDHPISQPAGPPPQETLDMARRFQEAFRADTLQVNSDVSPFTLVF